MPLLFLLVVIVSLRLQAFPEMIRHHYINCSACHVSTTGGGLLNAYGRTISHELLSTWGSDKEARAFYFADPEKIGEWLNIGGDVRDLQLQQENSEFKTGRNIWMEANIQLALTLKNVTAYGSFGQVKQSNQSFESKPTRYYISYQYSDEISLRLGRYIPIYGLNIPQHNYFVRKNLSLGPGSERDVVDIQYNGENWNYVLGFSKSLLDSSVRDEEQALHLQILKNINDQHKVGFNYWYGEATNYRKIAAGLQGVLGWTERFYSLVEVDHLWIKDEKDIEEKSISQLAKVGYEIEKGFHLQAVQEWTSSSFDNIKAVGVGFIWYPRPHFEIESLYTKRLSEAATFGVEDYAYLMTHFYF